MPLDRATADDVAQRAGVSRATVSYVLNNNPNQKISQATREKVLAAAESLSYTPSANARSLSRGRSDLVVMLTPDWPLGTIIPEVMEVIAREISPYGLELMLYRYRNGYDLRRLWRVVTPAAVIRFGNLGLEEDARLREAQVGHLIEVSDGESAGLDLFPGKAVGITQATHLIGRGHQLLGYAWPDDQRLARMAKARLSGVARACHDRGLPEPVVKTVSLDPGQAELALADWIALGVTAVACFNDDVALALIRAGREAEFRVPQDLALIGVDNQTWGTATEPTLSTVGANPALIGNTIAASLIADLTNKDAPPVPTDLVRLTARDSS